MINSAELVDPIFTLKCKRKHVLMDQDYYLYLYEDLIVISQKQSSSKAKYNIELNLSIVVHFLTKDSLIQAFGLQLTNQFKWFHGKNEDILILKEKLRNKVMFSHVLDFYEPKKILGQGVSSQVYMIYDFANKIEFASKCIPKAYLQEDKLKKLDTQVATLITEIKILRKLNHPSILKIHEVFEGHSTYYIILELLRGPTLSKLIRQQNEPFEINDIRKIFTKILEAVAYIHSNNLIHRDIKPENIMLKDATDFESVKVIDFGFSTECDVKSYLYPKCGTPGYVAPEIINLQDLTKKYSNKCDLFSCGVILYKLFTRQNLFPGTNTEAILKLNKKCHLNLSLLTLYRVPKAGSDLIIKLLQQDPINRITAQEALEHPFILGTEMPVNLEISQFQEQQFFSEQSLITVDETPQLLPQSNIPYFKMSKEFGSFVMKHDLDSGRLNLKIDYQLGFNAFSPQESRPKFDGSHSLEDPETLMILSVGGQKKKSHFIYFQQHRQIQQVQEEIPELDEEDQAK